MAVFPLLKPSSSKLRVPALDPVSKRASSTTEMNAGAIRAGRVEIRQGSVSQLPYASGTFDLVTAVETIYFWPDLAADMREVWRVVRPGGMIAIVCEVYKGAQTAMSVMVQKCAPEYGMKMLSPEEHRNLLLGAGFNEVQVFTDEAEGWVCSTGLKPLSAV